MDECRCRYCGQPIEPDGWIGPGVSPTGWIHASGWMGCGEDDAARRVSGTVATE